MAAMSDAQPSKLNLWMDFLATNKVDETSAPLPAALSRYLGVSRAHVTQVLRKLKNVE
jgi:Mn-dependent DtxR family transcriptional regulator